MGGLDAQPLDVIGTGNRVNCNVNCKPTADAALQLGHEELQAGRSTSPLQRGRDGKNCLLYRLGSKEQLDMFSLTGANEWLYSKACCFWGAIGRAAVGLEVSAWTDSTGQISKGSILVAWRLERLGEAKSLVELIKSCGKGCRFLRVNLSADVDANVKCKCSLNLKLHESQPSKLNKPPPGLPE